MFSLDITFAGGYQYHRVFGGNLITETVLGNGVSEAEVARQGQQWDATGKPFSLRGGGKPACSIGKGWKRQGSSCLQKGIGSSIASRRTIAAFQFLDYNRQAEGVY